MVNLETQFDDMIEILEIEEAAKSLKPKSRARKLWKQSGAIPRSCLGPHRA